MIQFTGPQVFRRLCCIGDIQLSDHEAVKQDIANFKAAIAASKPVDAFMPAASPGVVSAFQPNRHYPNHAAYIGAVADAMQEDTRRSPMPGSWCNSTVPISRWRGTPASRT